VIDEIIRGVIGFDGLLLSDDVSMNALEGAVGLRAERSLAAGCDIALHCNGLMDEMEAVAAVAPVLAGPALERATRALSAIAEPDTVDLEAIHARLDRALAEATDAGI